MLQAAEKGEYVSTGRLKNKTYLPQRCICVLWIWEIMEVQTSDDQIIVSTYLQRLRNVTSEWSDVIVIFFDLQSVKFLLV